MRFIPILLAAVLSLSPALAHPLNRMATALKAPFNGMLWLPECNGNFGVTNILKNSNDMTNGTYWFLLNSGSSNISVTANTTDVTDPNGGNTANKLVIPAVSGTNATDISNDYSGEPYAAGDIVTGSLWLRGSVGGEQVDLRLGSATSGSQQTFTLSQQWTRVPVSFVTTDNHTFVQLGVLAPGSSRPSVTVYAWQEQLNQGTTAMPLVKTTSAVATKIFNIDCPSGVKFRDYSRLTTWNGGNDTRLSLTPPGAAGSYNAQYTGTGSFRSYQQIGGTFYGFTYNAPTGAPTPLSIGVWSGSSPLTITDPGTSINPILSAGSGGAWDSALFYNAFLSPISFTGHNFTLFYMAQNGGGTQAIGVATANTITGPWTKDPGNPYWANQSMPTGYASGNTLYLLVSYQTENDLIRYQYTAAGFVSGSASFRSLPPAPSTDWDNGFQPQEPYAFINRRGYLELTYMVYDPGLGGADSAVQVQGYAVSAGPDQPWFRRNFPIIGQTRGISDLSYRLGWGCQQNMEIGTEFYTFGCSGLPKTGGGAVGGTWVGLMQDN